MTPSDLASTILWTAYLRKDIQGKLVIDLGCGTGKFCLGVTVLRGNCVCIELDREAIMEAKSLLREFDNPEFIEADVESLEISKKVDTVIQNPPFGVVKQGMDMVFLRKALSISTTVYSIHKSNPKTQQLIERISKEYGFQYEMLTSRYRMKPYYPWHTKNFHEFQVDVYLFYKNNFSF
ncbi:METTL5 family protein [Sulfolobus acidocaldarius]|uniref:METTL5 family protein n=1 Tax=Sulfolobus acidocaldarius TaxID=2285 RepID=UPI00159C67F8|nr:METTL5 family protein [Sulfolobus acidocaldarius]